MAALTIAWSWTSGAAQLREDSAIDELADIEASRNGDPDAYARIVARYQSVISAQMWRFTRDRGVLEELVQEVFVSAYNSLSSYRANAPFLHWLRRIATRTGYRYWQRQTRERAQREALASLPEEPAADGSASPSEAAEYAFLLLARLAPEDRLVLTLLHFEELDTIEIAERMGWSRTLVKVRAHRARKRLRGLLEAAGYGKGTP